MSDKLGLWGKNSTMKVKGILVVAFLLCFGFFSQTTVFAAVFSNSTQPFVNDLGHIRTKEHGILTALSFYIIGTFNQNPFLAPSDVVESDNPTIHSLAVQLTEKKETDIEKSEAIYTWITENIEYDAEYYYQVQNLSDFEFDSALETLVKKKSLCMGYAHLNAALHRAIGIEAKVVYGSDHAWNEIFIDGVWYSQDSTKGAGFIDQMSKTFVHSPSMAYFSIPNLEKDGDYLW